MKYDDEEKKLQEDINTNEEYVNVDDLKPEGKDGEALDTIEEDQVLPEEAEDDAKRQLRKINEGDDNDKDSILDEEDNHLS